MFNKHRLIFYFTLRNSLDAGAKRVDVLLKQGGTKLIEVRDTGSGISKDDLQLCGTSGATSKIQEFDELTNLSTYGFRGEALFALCCSAKVEIITKTAKDTVASINTFKSDGTLERYV